MKVILFTFAFLASAASFAGSTTKTVLSLNQKEAKIDLASVADAVVLGQNKTKDITVRLVTIDLGQSTDVSNRKLVFLTYFHGGEVVNTRTSFDLGPVREIKSIKRLAPGVYQIKVVSAFEKFENKTWTIDTTQVFLDDNKLDDVDGTEFYFDSELKLTEEVTP